MSVPPVAVLLDCSESELAKSLESREGNVDDNKEAVARRLQHYREITLPMLKSLDEEDRLRVVDGDRDVKDVIQDLQETLQLEILGSSINNNANIDA